MPNAQVVETPRCLICTPVGKDAELLLGTLHREDIPAAAYFDLEALGRGLKPHLDLIIILSEEALLSSGVNALFQRLREQPAWSSMPIVLFTAAGQRVSVGGERLLELFKSAVDITMLERPLRVQTLLSAVRSALRSRHRQYQIRDLLAQQERDARSLRETRDILEQRVQDRTRELTKSNIELLHEIEERTRAENALRQLSQHTIKLQDEERRRIARELHDSIGQSLAFAAMSVSALGRQLASEFDPEVGQIRKQLDQCVREVRTISHLLHPPLLDDIGLSSALKWYVAEFSERSQIHVDLEISTIDRLNCEIETAIFRIVQESLTNIHRHSGAENARVSLTSDEKLVKIAIIDNGRGISQDVLDRIASGRSGVGVTGIRERAKQLNGTFRIQSESQGTSLNVEIPLVG
jgi:signal transduction histidine kinase